MVLRLIDDHQNKLLRPKHVRVLDHKTKRYRYPLDVKVAVLYKGKTPDDRKAKRLRLENKQALFSRSYDETHSGNRSRVLVSSPLFRLHE